MSITVLGAGAFGTALAIAIGRERPVMLWARNAAHMLDTRQSARLPDVRLPDNVTVTADLDLALNNNSLLFALPMQNLSGFLQTIPTPLIGKALVACCKGLDLKTLTGPTALLGDRWPGTVTAMLTGPSFAADIAKGLPTALTLACADPVRGKALQERLSAPTLRLYLSADVTGAELGGALKNVIAIACGAAIGAELGDSARAALMTRGMAEITRLATHLGARPETLMGLSGFGDLVLTCSSQQSRNYRFGLGLERENSLNTVDTVEGIKTAQAVCKLAQTHGIDMPVCTMVHALCQGRISVADAVHHLLNRPLKEE